MNSKLTFLGNTSYRDLILAHNQFEGMEKERGFNPASVLGNHGERDAWESCVEIAYIFVKYGIEAIPNPLGFKDTYVWTHAYTNSIEARFPDGVRIGNTWFYNR
jgi:hypothetical protein